MPSERPDPWAVIVLLTFAATLLDLIMAWLGVSGEPGRSICLTVLMTLAFLALRLPGYPIRERPPFFMAALPPVAALVLGQTLAAALTARLHWAPTDVAGSDIPPLVAVIVSATLLLGFVPPLADWHAEHEAQFEDDHPQLFRDPEDD